MPAMATPLLVSIVALLLQATAPVAAAPATPAAIDRDGTLGAMLGRLPDLPLDQAGATVSYADVAGHLAALGMAPPGDEHDTAGRERWLEAASPLMLPSSIRLAATSPDWRAVFGFDLFQVDQAAAYEAPPLNVTVLRGRFDPVELRAAWERGGYRPVDLDGEAYAVRDDFAVDIADEGSRLALAALNVVALADDGSLIFGSTREGVRAALAATDGRRPAFADRTDVAPLVAAAPPDLVSALVVPGAFFQQVPDPAALLDDESQDAFATRIAAEESEARRLPPVVAGLVGQTAGAAYGPAERATPTPPGERSGRLVVVLATLTPGAAETAATVIAERLATQRASARAGDEVAGQRWADLFPERSVRAVPGTAAVVIDLAPAPGVPPFTLLDMLFRRAPGFLGWAP